MAAPDPFRNPVLDRVGHEAGHVAGLRWFGYSADVVTFDFRWGDYGHYGSFDGVHRTTGDPKREAFDHSTIAALGPLYGDESLHDRAAVADLRCIDLWVMPTWPLEAWRMRATDRARELAHTPAFSAMWRRIVVALHDLGDRYLELHGDEIDRFLASIPGADLDSTGAPRPMSRTSPETGDPVHRLTALGAVQDKCPELACQPPNSS